MAWLSYRQIVDLKRLKVGEGEDDGRVKPIMMAKPSILVSFFVNTHN
jgi:hypothetical protein